MKTTHPPHRPMSIRASVLVTLASKFVVFGLALLIVGWRGHAMGASAFGDFALAFSFPPLLALLFDCGVTAANIHYLGRGEVGLRQVVGVSLKLWALLSLLGILAGSFLIHTFGAKWFPGVDPRLLWYALALFPLLSIRGLIAGWFQALEDFPSFNRIFILDSVASLAATGLLLTFVSPSASSALLGVIVGTALSPLLSLNRLRQHWLTAPVHPNVPGYLYRCLSYGWMSTLANLFGYLNYRLDIFLLHHFCDAKVAGIYAGTLAIGERIWVLSQAISSVILPRLSRLQDVPDEASRVASRACRVTIGISLVASVGVAIAAPQLLTLLLGAQFSEGVTTLLILLPGFVLASGARITANALAAQGYVALNAWMAAGIVLCNLTLNLWLIPQSGMVGAGIASTLSWMFYATMSTAVLTRTSQCTVFSLLIPKVEDLQLLRAFSFLRLPVFIQRRSWVPDRWRPVLLALASGLLLTAYLEHLEIQMVGPLRSLVLFGRWKQRDQDPFAASHYRHGSGINPVHVAQSVRADALQILESNSLTPASLLTEEKRTAIRRVADFFYTTGETRQHNKTTFRIWSYDFPYPPYGLPTGWYSGMAQGHVVEVALAAWKLSDDPKYLDLAKLAGNACRVSINDGGVAVPLKQGMWFEEYAAAGVSAPQVLNGHNFALNGLWHLSQVDPEYRPLFDDGVDGLRSQLRSFDAMIWSHYDRVGTPANQKYQAIHYAQMHDLASRTGDPIFTRYEMLFLAQLATPLHVPYRLVVFPTRALVGLVLANTAISAGVLFGLHALKRRGRARTTTSTRIDSPPILRRAA